MANEKMLNTRVLLKYDSYINWTTNNPTLLAGEIAIAKLVNDVTVPVDESKNAPVLFKAGPGKFNDLPWASALAADVYAWAKKENPDWTDFPALPLEIVDEEEGQFITGIAYDSNKITITRGDVDLSDYALAKDKVVDLTFVNDGVETDAYYLNISSTETALASMEVKSTGYTTLTTDNGAMVIGTSEALDTAIANAQSGAEATAAAALSKARGEISTEIDNDIAAARELITQEIADALPTELGVMSVTGKEAIAVSAGANPEVSLTLDPASGNVVLTQSATGLKANVDLSAYRLIADDEDTKYGLTYDENTKQIKLVENGGADHIDASDFVIDGMLASVVADQTNNTLTFTWNTDGGETVTTINLSDIADIYTGSTGTTVNVGMSNTNVISAEVVAGSLTDSHIAANAGIAETKLAEGVQTALGLARTALQSHQSLENYYTKSEADAAFLDAEEAKAIKVDNAVNADKLGNTEAANYLLKSEATGYADILTKTEADSLYLTEEEIKAVKVDNATHADAAAKVDNKLTITANGAATEFDGSAAQSLDLDAIYLREHQDLSDYATKIEMSNQGAAILAEAQKYADSLNHEDTKYSAAVDGGLKLNENNEFAIDDSVTFVFYCGSSTDLV